jgi:hypothetical protein
MEDRSNPKQTEWAGIWKRNRSKFMFGDVVLKGGQPFCYETMYDHSRGDVIEWRSEAACHWDNGEPPLRSNQTVSPDWYGNTPVPQGTVIERSPPPVVMQQQPAPAPQPAPAAAVIVQAPPAQPPLVLVVPGTTYSPTPKQEKEGS